MGGREEITQVFPLSGPSRRCRFFWILNFVKKYLPLPYLFLISLSINLVFHAPRVHSLISLTPAGKRAFKGLIVGSAQAIDAVVGLFTSNSCRGGQRRNSDSVLLPQLHRQHVRCGWQNVSHIVNISNVSCEITR